MPYTTIGWIIAIITAHLVAFNVEPAFAHCDTVFQPQPSTISYHYRPNQNWSSRTSWADFAASYRAKTGFGLSEATSAELRAASDSLRRPQAPAVSSGSSGARPEMQGDDDQSRQHELVIALVYISKLYEEEETQTLIEYIAQLREQGILQAADTAERVYDDGDLNNAFSVPFLADYITRLETWARMETHTHFDKAYADLLKTGVIEAKAIQAAETPLPELLPTAPAQRAYGPVVAFAKDVGNRPNWERMQVLSEYDPVLGVTDVVDGELDLFIEAEGATALNIDAQSGYVDLLAAEYCRDHYIDRYVAEAQSRETDAFAMVSLVVNDSGQYVVQWKRDGMPYHFVVEGKVVDKIAESGASAAAGSELDELMEELRRAGKALVLWSHPMMQKPGPYMDATQRFAHVLLTAYPENSVYVDAPAFNLAEYVERIERSTVGTDRLSVILDISSIGTDLQEDFADAAQQWAELLGDDNIIYYTDDLGPSSLKGDERGVIVITGRTDERLRAFVRELGSKGYLANNYVVLESCGEAISAQIVAEINGRYGAAGTFHYRSRIHPEDALRHAESIIQQVAGRPKPPFSRAVVDGMRNGRESRRRDMDGLWTICHSEASGVPSYG